MRIAARNQRSIWFANYKGMQPIKDIHGWETGHYFPSYTDPTVIRANISPNKGEASLRPFGESLDYDRTVLFGGMSPLTELSVLWIDCLIAGKIPQIDGENVPHDYVVRRIAESLPSTGHTLIATKKVDVSFSRVVVLSPTEFQLLDIDGNPLHDIDGKLLFAIGKMLYDIEGNPLQDSRGNKLVVEG